MPRRKGSKDVFSAQEAMQMIFMDTESEGDDVDLGDDDIYANSDLDSDFEPTEEDTESSDGEISFSTNKRKRGNVDKHLITIIYLFEK